ncbi:MAG TPA: AraC family ligand binding domain-containing protein, partial [Candidatus Methylacidiphilales bacterium]
MTTPRLNHQPGRVAQATGFPGQRLVVVHPPQIARISRLVLLRPFCPTDIGLFPAAAHHERRRAVGISQTIFIRCSRGSGWCDIDGTRRIICENDLLIIPAHCAHAYGASDQDPWSIEWFHAIGIGLPDYLRRLGVSRRAPVLALRPGVWNSALFAEALSSLETGFTEGYVL